MNGTKLPINRATGALRGEAADRLPACDPPVQPDQHRPEKTRTGDTVVGSVMVGEGLRPQGCPGHHEELLRSSVRQQAAAGDAWLLQVQDSAQPHVLECLLVLTAETSLRYPVYLAPAPPCYITAAVGRPCRHVEVTHTTEPH